VQALFEEQVRGQDSLHGQRLSEIDLESKSNITPIVSFFATVQDGARIMEEDGGRERWIRGASLRILGVAGLHPENAQLGNDDALQPALPEIAPYRSRRSR